MPNWRDVWRMIVPLGLTAALFLGVHAVVGHLFATAWLAWTLSIAATLGILSAVNELMLLFGDE